MPKVKIKEPFGGNGIDWQPGAIVEVTEKERDRMVSRGLAEPWVEEKEEPPRPRTSKKKRTARRSSSSATEPASTSKT